MNMDTRGLFAGRTRGLVGCFLAVAGLSLAACSEPSSPEPANPEPASPEPVAEAPASDPAPAPGEAGSDPDLATAEAFIDAFYSFDPDRLRPFFTDPALATPEAAEFEPRLMYYQGWAEGGNYKVVERAPCARTEADVVACPITVEDDPVLALRTNFNVTDTFAITFQDSRIAAVDTSSNDQPVYYQARKWVEENLPDLIEVPCQDAYNGGPTPGDCARAMTEGYRRFAASDAYPL